jgi:hypothetical protein
VTELLNKQIVVLELLRSEGELTAKRVAALIMERTPCAACDGSGGNGEYDRCRACYGRGRMYFGYGDAYRVLVALEKRGLVLRVQGVDRWGDRTPGVSWLAAPCTDPDDPLERAFRAPSAGGAL